MTGRSGEDRTFTTAANPKPPTISSQRARDIANNSATATAAIDPNGSATSYRIEYGTTSRYGNDDRVGADADHGCDDVAVKLTGLRPYTRYHWRTIATNAAGTARGTNRSFRTARQPSGVTLSLSRRTVPWGGDVRLGGRVSGAGVSGMTVALEQQRVPADSGFSQVDTVRTGRDGGYLFTIPKLWSTTHYRVVTRTQVVATSPVATARSRVRVGVRARHHVRRRARIEGSVLPGVAGAATLQLYRRGLGWEDVRSATLVPTDATSSRYRFTVRRLKRTSRRFRVRGEVEGGAHVRGWSRKVKVRPRPKKRR